MKTISLLTASLFAVAMASCSQQPPDIQQKSSTTKTQPAAGDSTPTAAAETDDAQQIQGFWAGATYVQDGQGEGETIDPKESPVRWVFKESKVTLLTDVDEATSPHPNGTFKLDPTKDPKTIDITFPPEAGVKKSQVILGIYEIKGDTLKICYGSEDTARPNEFKSSAGSKLILIGFKRMTK